MSEPKFYAHSLEGEPGPHRQGLEEHPLGVARLAARFAEAFHSESRGFCAGLWHDLGKYQIEFQARLLGSRVLVEHSGAGAALAFEESKELGMPLVFVIAGQPGDFMTRNSTESFREKPNVADKSEAANEWIRP
jgi:CRISPR-associated endonuclease/helicase Cas3